MSVTNYSKWDKIELSDDEDQEVHPNIDKASWIRMMQRKIHQEREDRRLRIAQMKSEQNTNTQLKQLMVEMKEKMSKMDEQEKRQLVEKLLKDLDQFERERKPKLMDQESAEFMQIKDIQEVFLMLLGRLLTENKLDRKTNLVADKLPQILQDEGPKIDKRMAELVETIAKEEKEQAKKLTSENISKEGFSKTIINPKKESQATKTGKKKESAIEVLNPGNVGKHAASAKTPSQKPEDVDLRELSLLEEKMMLDFAAKTSYEDSYKYIQDHPEIVSREYCDHLMARAFKCQMDGRIKEAKKCVKWSLALQYCLQMGGDGPGLFYKRMTKNGPEPIAMFEQDVDGTYDHITRRAKVLAEKQSSPDVNEDNSNLTPEQAEAFKSFPKHFQEALFRNDINSINESFAKMPKEEADKIMAKCQKTGLISILSDDEAKKLVEEDQATKAALVDQSHVQTVQQVEP